MSGLDAPAGRPHTLAEITWAMDEAAAHRHRWRAMRVTLECGHLRLMAWQNVVLGIGAHTGCSVCPGAPARQVVNVEETGVLHDDWHSDGVQP